MKKNRVLGFGLLVALLVLLSWLYFDHHTVAVLAPKGVVAERERTLIIFTVLLSLIVVLPVYVLTFLIAHKYRASNKSAKYSPDWDHNLGMELLWWAIPGLIILVLSVVTWQSSHALDPFRPISSKTKDLNVQVVALDWKWLFIYPDNHLASVNSLEIPVNTPVNFNVTADAPMNSFWIPQLGSQIYAMPGMATQLHAMATQAGNYYGSSANISGQGFAGMNFIVHAVDNAQFSNWLKQNTTKQLNFSQYLQLAQPSQNNAPAVYKLTDNQLYGQIISKYLVPAGHYSVSPVGMMH